MTPLILLPKLFLAGGASFLGGLDFPANIDVMNHTLAGEKIPASQVVCRSRWGTPMPPDNKAGYSLIAPINAGLIAQSLWIPPVSGTRPVVPTASTQGPKVLPQVPADATAIPASVAVPVK
jgi:hypothetical protein